LGNVTTQVSDRKTGTLATNDIQANVLSYQQYYPFGWNMPGRSKNIDKSRFAFNGKELDSEWGIQDYGMRMYDNRVAKFLSVDPLRNKYPELTTYQFASNRPIWAIDLDGLEAIEYQYKRFEYNSDDGLFSAGAKFIANSGGAIVNGGLGTINYSVEVGQDAYNNGISSATNKVVTDVVINPATNAYEYVTVTPLSQMGADAYGVASNPESWENLAGALIFKKVALPKKINVGKGGSKDAKLEIAVKQTSLGNVSHVKIGVEGDWYDFAKDPPYSDVTNPQIEKVPKTGSWQETKPPNSDYNVYETMINSTSANKLKENIINSGSSNFSYPCNNCATNASKMLNKSTEVKTKHGGIIPGSYTTPTGMENGMKNSNDFKQSKTKG
jgi:RHS repeat-associated protein